MIQHRLTFAFDMDGVTADLHLEWYHRYNADYDDDLKIDDITEWSTHKFVKPECGLKMYSYLHEPGLFSGLDPIPGAVDGVKRVWAEGHRVVFITRPPAECGHAYVEKRRWVAKHFPEIVKDIGEVPIIFTQNKAWANADVLLDDAPHHLDEFPGLSIALWYAYNDGHGAVVVKSWDEFTMLATALGEYGVENLLHKLGKDGTLW